MWPPIDQLTVDGYDLTFGTNVLGKVALVFVPFTCYHLFRPFLFHKAIAPYLNLDGAVITRRQSACR